MAVTPNLQVKAVLLFLFLLLFALPAFGQSSSASNFGFVSPNTREGLKLDDAIAGLSSEEETSLVRRVGELRCVVHNPINTRRAVGSWSDGAEHSLLIRVRSDESTMRYLMSRLGRTANQKAVVYFHSQPAGTAKIYIIHPAKRLRSFTVISRILDANGVAFRTLVPLKTEVTVYVIDLDNSLSAKVRAATRRLRGRLTALTGNASFIGDDSVREKGQEIFLKEIASYESIHTNLSTRCKRN
jgi:hypothetical protein